MIVSAVCSNYEGISYDLSTWPRILANGANAARSLAANGGLPKIRERGEDLALATLVLDAWRDIAEHAADGRGYR